MNYIKGLMVVLAILVALVWYKNKPKCSCSSSQLGTSGQVVATNHRCSLSNSELDKRKSTMLLDLKDRIQEWHELSDGYSFQFSGDDRTAKDLTDFVLFERNCCSFVSFILQFEPTGGPIRLELRGGKAVKEQIGIWFESVGLGTPQ